MPTNGVTDFEIPSEPDRASYFAWCEKRWGVVPRPRWEEMTFMGDDVFQTGSNIFLSNGTYVFVRPRRRDRDGAFFRSSWRVLTAYVVAPLSSSRSTIRSFFFR